MILVSKPMKMAKTEFPAISNAGSCNKTFLEYNEALLCIGAPKIFSVPIAFNFSLLEET